MLKLCYSILVVIFSVMVGLSYQQVPLSPCPEVFSYENDGEQWFGLIKIQNPEFDGVVNLTVNLTIDARLPTSFVGRIELLGTQSEIRRNLINGLNIKYRVHFPLLDILPVVTSVVVNGKEFCRGRRRLNPAVTTSTATTNIELQHELKTEIRRRPAEPLPEENTDTNNYYTRPDDTYKPENSNINREVYDDFYSANTEGTENYFSWFPRRTTSPRLDDQTDKHVSRDTTKYGNRFKNGTEANEGHERPNPDTFATRVPQYSRNPSTNIQKSDLQRVCGKTIIVSNGLIVNGETTKKGEWPWLIALYVKNTTGLNFICSGSLILDNLVVTAAHCVAEKGNRPVRKEELVIKLGVFNLQNWVDEDTKTREVNDIILHHSYKGGVEINGDIALLKFNPVLFTDYIRPVCLWSGNDDLSLVVGSLGTVIGWGKDENGLLVTNEPRLSKVPIVSTLACRGSRVEFFSITSNTTLCAGSKDGSGPCNGDSGGGLYMYDVEARRWVLRGIVSQSLIEPNSLNRCNLNEYIVFTDSAKYLQWIQSHM